LFSLSPSPTSSRISGTLRSITFLGFPITSRAKATFSKTVLSGRSLKSWNTVPTFRRRYGTFHGDRWAMSFPATQMLPRLGSSSFSRRRMNVDFPDPDGPTTKTNSPLRTSMLTSSRATTESL
jgi:hypothetical protein